MHVVNMRPRPQQRRLLIRLTENAIDMCRESLPFSYSSVQHLPLYEGLLDPL